MSVTPNTFASLTASEVGAVREMRTGIEALTIFSKIAEETLPLVDQPPYLVPLQELVSDT